MSDFLTSALLVLLVIVIAAIVKHKQIVRIIELLLNDSATNERKH